MNMLLLPSLSLVIATLPIAAAETAQLKSHLPQEVVLREGMSLSFTNANGSGTVKYVSPIKRSYSFGREGPGTIELIARPARFMGTLGLYSRGERWVGIPSGKSRLVAVECEQHFGSMEELRKFLYEGSAVQKWVYNQDGYVVGYFASPGREQRNLTLYRYFIKGKPARFLRGYDNSKVRISYRV